MCQIAEVGLLLETRFRGKRVSCSMPGMAYLIVKLGSYGNVVPPLPASSYAYHRSAHLVCGDSPPNKNHGHGRLSKWTTGFGTGLTVNVELVSALAKKKNHRPSHSPKKQFYHQIARGQLHQTGLQIYGVDYEEVDGFY